AEYANAIAANPANASNVIVGGLDIYSSTTGGSNLTKRTDWTTSTNGTNYAHADIHLLKYNPYKNQLFALSDAGLFHSESNGLSWSQEMNNNLGTFDFVGGDLYVPPSGSLSNGAFFVAGAQDNGPNKLTYGSTNYNALSPEGDGGTMFV